MTLRNAAFCLLTLCLFTTTTFADGPQDAWMKLFVGNWEFTNVDGTPGTVSITKDGSSDTLIMRGKIGDHTWLSVMAWNEHKKAIVDHAFGIDGGRFESVFTDVAAQEIAGTRSGWSPSNGEQKGNVTFKKVDENTLEFSATNQTFDGNPADDVKIELTRVKGGPAVLAPPKADKDQTDR